MSEDFADKRQFPRVSFFSPSNERGLLPDWAFRRVPFQNAPAGLVMNLSDGGLQVLISAGETLTTQRHDVVLLVGEEDQVTWFNGIVETAWARPLGDFGQLLGLSFVKRNSTAEKFLLSYPVQPGTNAWVRCVLMPVKG
ncbi:hypothetical protein [Pelomonas sp. SE-A7]|uniref:hypothetical protein n=1 Tax=Pelomonas sp. SE-A7 TaxID=3054953 RepID=UPI00259CC7A7|nr:hypothetical protein [Pelomonas sp. SE-A7]MDM4765580.1 hypothetical protein [Pelomonas sp. SE-A7]